jgi:hypothetical protein
MKASEFPKNVVFRFVTDSQELDCICAYLGIHDAREHITAAMISTCNGDYDYVYFSENTNFKQSRYWDWEPYWYYVDETPTELELQDE